MALYKDGKVEPLLRMLKINWVIYNYNGQGISYANPNPLYNVQSVANDSIDMQKQDFFDKVKSFINNRN